MNNFQYNEAQTDDAIALIKNQKHRLAKQQLIFAAIFVAVCIFLGIYVVSRSIYVYYDGYIRMNNNPVRAYEDMLVLHTYVNVGDSVAEGDTLFSYVLLPQLLTQNDVNVVPLPIQHSNDMKVQAALARQKIPVLQQQLASLEKQLASEKNDIYFGLTNNTAKNELRAQIADIKEQIRAQVKIVSIYERAHGMFQAKLNGTGYGRNPMPFSPWSGNFTNSMVHYAVAPAASFVIDVKSPDYSVMFKQEDVIDLRYLSIDQANLSIMVYVPVDKVGELLKNDSAQVIIGDQIVLQAHLTRMGLGVQELPKNLVNNFNRNTKVLMASMEFNKGERAPRWICNDQLPVRVRVVRWRNNVDSTSATPARLIRVSRDPEFFKRHHIR